MRMVSSAGFGQFRFPASSAPPPQNFPVGLDATKTFFVDLSGNPCFALGEDASDLAVMLNSADVNLYLSDRASRGINIIWVTAIDNLVQALPPNNFNGDAPFSGSDFTNFNPAYWSYLDQVMQKCLVRGITVLLDPVFPGTSAADGYFTTFKAASTATIGAYGTFLGNRYKGFPNLIWLLGGDSDPADATVYTNLAALAVAIKAADPGHLMTLEAARVLEAGGTAPNGGLSSVDAHIAAYGSVQSWLDFNWVYQTGPTVTTGAQRCYGQASLPCLLGEDWYELDHSMTEQGIRLEGYGSVLGGCTLGRLFGNQQIWPFNGPGGNGGVVTPSWQSQLSSAGSVGQQLLGKLFRSRHHLLVPDISNVVMTVPGTSICARDSEGKTIIAYLPTSQTITIDMSKITDAGSLASCNWYNPQTGAVTNIGTFANSSTRNFTSPDSNDWVLVIDSNAAALRTPGT